MGESGHGEALAVGLLVVVEVGVASQDLDRVAVLRRFEPVVLDSIVPHLARESRAAHIAAAIRPARPLDVRQVLVVAVAVVIAR